MWVLESSVGWSKSYWTDRNGEEGILPALGKLFATLVYSLVGEWEFVMFLCSAFGSGAFFVQLQLPLHEFLRMLIAYLDYDLLELFCG